jgi:hypothetical protein
MISSFLDLQRLPFGPEASQQFLAGCGGGWYNRSVITSLASLVDWLIATARPKCEDRNGRDPAY